MRIQLLGAVEIHGDNGPVGLQRAGEKCVLAALAVNVGRRIALTTLVDWVWEPAEQTDNSLQTVRDCIKKVRSAIKKAGGNPNCLVYDQSGQSCVLDVDSSHVDLHRFRSLVASARQARDIATYRQALGLWQAQPLANLRNQWASNRRADLEAERLIAHLDLLELQLAAGRHAEVAQEAADMLENVIPNDQLLILGAQGLAGSGRHTAIDAWRNRVAQRMRDTVDAAPSPQSVRQVDKLIADPDWSPTTSVTSARPVEDRSREMPASGWFLRLRRRLDGGLIAFTTASLGIATATVALLLTLSWSTLALMLASSVGILAVIRSRRPARLSRAWKLVCIAIVPLLVGTLAALLGSRTPPANSTGDDPAGKSSTDRSASNGSTGDDSRRGAPPGSTGPGPPPPSGASSTRAPYEGPYNQPTKGEPPAGSTHNDPTHPSPSLHILDVNHTFTPDTDRVTVTVRNTRADRVLIKQIGVYLDDITGGHPWSDGDMWHFEVPTQMWSGEPGADGSRRTHGLIRIGDAALTTTLVGQGWVGENGWRRLLTFDPQNFLPGSATSTIVIELPLVHLLQQTSTAQPAGPMVEQRFDPQEGSVLTYVELQSPDERTFQCDYIRRAPDKPTCDTVNPAAAVQLPR